MSNYHRASHRASEEHRWGSDYEIAKAHAVPSKGTVGVLGRNGQDYDVYSPGNPGYLGSPGHKTPTKTKTTVKVNKAVPQLSSGKTKALNQIAKDIAKNPVQEYAKLKNKAKKK